MRPEVTAVLLAISLMPAAASAELFFASFHSYDPIGAYEFGQSEKLPAVGIVYARSSVGGRFTEISVSIDDPNFRILAHTCPSVLANGTSCMIYFTFDPARGNPESADGARVFRSELEISSREGSARLPVSAYHDTPGKDAGIDGD